MMMMMMVMILPQLIFRLLESNHRPVLIAMHAAKLDIVENVCTCSQGTAVRVTEAR